MDTWLIVLIVVAALVVLALLALPAIKRRRDGRLTQRRVETRARVAEADRHETRAEQAIAGVPKDRESAERERELAAQHARAAEQAEHRVAEREAVAEREREAAAAQRDRARRVDPD